MEPGDWVSVRFSVTDRGKDRFTLGLEIRKGLGLGLGLALRIGLGVKFRVMCREPRGFEAAKVLALGLTAD